MPYQYKREPPIQEEATRLVQACESHEERLVVWTLLDSGLRVGEFSSLSHDDIDWQSHPYFRFTSHLAKRCRRRHNGYGTLSRHTYRAIAARRRRRA